MIEIGIYKDWDHSRKSTMFFYTQKNTIVDYVDYLDELKLWL